MRKPPPRDAAAAILATISTATARADSWGDRVVMLTAAEAHQIAHDAGELVAAKARADALEANRGEEPPEGPPLVDVKEGRGVVG